MNTDQTKYWLCCGSTVASHDDARAKSCIERAAGNPHRCSYATVDDHAAAAVLEHERQRTREIISDLQFDGLRARVLTPLDMPADALERFAVAALTSGTAMAMIKADDGIVSVENIAQETWRIAKVMVATRPK